ncbi:MAG: hypothetical protein ACK46L_12695, partial [Synechococcaceae cyanobacterium]
MADLVLWPSWPDAAIPPPPRDRWLSGAGRLAGSASDAPATRVSPPRPQPVLRGRGPGEVPSLAQRHHFSG